MATPRIFDVATQPHAIVDHNRRSCLTPWLWLAPHWTEDAPPEPSRHPLAISLFGLGAMDAIRWHQESSHVLGYAARLDGGCFRVPLDDSVSPQVAALLAEVRVRPIGRRRGRVLVIQAEVMIADVIDEVLVEEGYEVVHRTETASSRDIARLHPEVIITDLRVPTHDPVAALTRLQADARHANARVIACSGATNLLDEIANDPTYADVIILPMPFDLDDLSDVVGQCMGR